MESSLEICFLRVTEQAALGDVGLWHAVLRDAAVGNVDLEDAAVGFDGVAPSR